MDEKVVVLLSGGLDSTTCLHWAIEKFGGVENVSAVTFRYSQRHSVEIDAARKIAADAMVPEWNLINADVFRQFEDSALVSTFGNISSSHRVGDLPASFVPGRNLVFLTLAAAFAYQREIRNVVIGATQIDYSGYPDCRGEFILSAQRTIGLGFDFPEFRIHAPLLYLGKKEIIQLAVSLDALSALGSSISCYNGSIPPCGSCPSCVLRAKGFQEAGIPDPALA